MRLNMEATVLGMKRAKGTMDNGNAYSSTRIYVEDSLGEGKEDVRGSSVSAYKIGPAEEFEKYKALPFPFRAKLLMDTEADGKGGTRLTVVGIEVIQPAKKAA